MIWLEPLEHIDKGVFILGDFFNFLCLNWYFLGVDINCCRSYTDETHFIFLIFLGSFSKFPVHTPALLCIGVPRRCWHVQHTFNLARTNSDVIFGEEKQIWSAFSS